MRPLRSFKPNRCYHLISRIAHRAFFLTEDERTRFVERLWRVAGFSGVEVLAYCFMSNHFHLLVYVPEAADLNDEELFTRIGILYSGARMREIRKTWEMLDKAHDESHKNLFRQSFLRRMYDVSAFMKTLKQNSTMSYNCRRVHSGTMWESRFRVREIEADDKAGLMKAAGYIDRNPVKAKMAPWPDRYEWCGFAAACKGDRRCIDGYRFIYTFAPIEWDKIRELHEQSIHLALKELEDKLLPGMVRRGLSNDEEKSQKVRQKAFARIEQAIPDRVPRLLDKGSNKVAFDLLMLLADGPMRPSDLRAALGIASANFFTARYLTPLASAGYIAVEGGEKNRYSPDKRYKLLRRGKAVTNA